MPPWLASRSAPGGQVVDDRDRVAACNERGHQVMPDDPAPPVTATRVNPPPRSSCAARVRCVRPPQDRCRGDGCAVHGAWSVSSCATSSRCRPLGITGPAAFWHRVQRGRSACVLPSLRRLAAARAGTGRRGMSASPGRWVRLTLFAGGVVLVVGAVVVLTSSRDGARPNVAQPNVAQCRLASGQQR